jgi:hypothetical protein
MGIIPDNWIDVFAIVWLEWMVTRPAYWSVYGQLADNHRYLASVNSLGHARGSDVRGTVTDK